MLPHVKPPPETLPPPKPRLTRAESQARTRAALLDAGERMFVERGFLGASVEVISEAAGYSRGAFYSNFESKEQLFAELLQERVYARYRDMANDSGAGERRSLGELGRRLAGMQADPAGQWLFRLWLELLAHAGRDAGFLTLAAQFWRGTRALGATAIEERHAAAGQIPRLPAATIATAMIALDIGLALQHFVDPDGASLDLYPQLYEALFAQFEPD
jgi:AcrR family transcriptional regulator